MGIFDFFKGKNGKSKKNDKGSRNVQDSFDKPVDLTMPRVENGILSVVYNHHIKGGTFFIPSDAHTIVSFAFMNCDNLETLVFHDGVRFIDTGAFSSCKNLKKIIGLEKQRDLKTIDGFARCSSLESVSLPDTIEVIRNSAFKDCTKLKTLRLPENCWCIGDHAFENCFKLEGVEISPKVTMIGKDAFKSCYELSVVFTDDPNKEELEEKKPEEELEIESGAFVGVKAVYATDVKTIEKVIASGFRGVVAYLDKEKDQIISMDLNMIENLYFDSLEGEEEEDLEVDVVMIDELYKARFGEPTAEELAEEERLMSEEKDDELGDE